MGDDGGWAVMVPCRKIETIDNALNQILGYRCFWCGNIG